MNIIKSIKHEVYWFKPIRILRDKLQDVKNIIYFVKHGYSSADWWSYDSNNAMRAVKCLRKLRDEGHGCPGNSNYQPVGIDEDDRKWWYDILSEMIFAWEEVLIALWDETEIIEVCGKERLSHIQTFTYHFPKDFRKPTETIEHVTTKNYVLRPNIINNRDYYNHNDMYQVQTRADYDRMINGFKLYLKYYFSLWD